MDVLERADGELMIRYQGEAVDYQEGPPPSSALWGAARGCSPGPELQEATDGVVNNHLNEAQRERLAALESSGSSEEVAHGDVGAGRAVQHLSQAGQQVRVGGGVEDVGVGHGGYGSSSSMTTAPFGRQLTVSRLSSRRPMPRRGSLSMSRTITDIGSPCQDTAPS